MNSKLESIKKSKFSKVKWDLMLLFVPGFVVFFIFNYVPIAGLSMAFEDFNMLDGFFKSPWVGFDNFRRLFESKDFLIVLKNTFVIATLKIVFAFPAPIIFALLLNEINCLKFKKTVQTCSYLPHFFSWVILGGIIKQLFANGGAVNDILKSLGIVSESVPFFSNGIWFIVLLVITHMWQTFGWSSILYISTISGIDESLYEAARIDGAGKFKQAVKITLPLLMPTIITMLILNMGNLLNAGLDHVYNLYNLTVYKYADILDTYVLRRMQSMDYSLSTAAGLFKSVVALAFVVAANKISVKCTDGEMGIW